MEFVPKEINEGLNREVGALESDRVEDFKRKSTKRFFATLSAYIDYGWYKKQNKNNDEASWERYCNQATNQLQSGLKRLGLEYQKVTGVWGNIEKSFLVWNTNYTFEQFQALMLKLNENYKQFAICIGKWVDGQYSIKLWETKSLDEIEYQVASQFTKVSVVDALKESGTVLTRHIYYKGSTQGRPEDIDSGKTRAILFESLEENICCAASEGMGGFYERQRLLKEFLGK